MSRPPSCRSAKWFAITALSLLCQGILLAQLNPLPSWNNGPARTAILDFVSRVTTKGGPDFVPVEERVATFDNDGTLWTSSRCMSS